MLYIQNSTKLAFSAHFQWRVVYLKQMKDATIGLYKLWSWGCNSRGIHRVGMSYCCQDRKTFIAPLCKPWETDIKYVRLYVLYMFATYVQPPSNCLEHLCCQIRCRSHQVTSNFGAQHEAYIGLFVSNTICKIFRVRWKQTFFKSIELHFSLCWCFAA